MNFLATPARRRILFAALYLSEGGPIGFLWWALPTNLRAEGVPIVEIATLTSLLALPWALKFLWAPLIDTLRSQRWSLRSWIISTQLLMGLSLIPMIFLDLGDHFSVVMPLLLFHAVAAATQDVSVDALAIRSTSPTERGKVNGLMQAGMLAGRAMFGGGALVLAHSIGEGAVIIALIGVIWSSSVLVFLSRESETNHSPVTRLREHSKRFFATLFTVLKQKSTWSGLCFAAIAGAGFESVGAVAGPFMIDRGLSREEVGMFFALPSVLGMVIGALVGGYVSDRLGRRPAVVVFLGALTASILVLVGADAWFSERIREVIPILLSGLYICIGLFTASSYALFMDITNPQLGATQFSAFMGATNFCESWSSFAVGRLIGMFGYPMAFGIMAGISLLSLPAVRFMVEAPVREPREAGSF